MLDVVRTPDLRRLQLAWAAYFLVDAVTLVALSVWAYREDGAAAVGALGLARLLPGALALPFGAWAADRYPRRRVTTLVFLAMAVFQAALVVALALDGPVALALALVACASVVAAPYRPAHLAIAPLVARSPDELVAINVTAGLLEGLVTLVGPALAAVAVALVDPWAAVVVSAAACVGGFACVLRVDIATDPSAAARRSGERPLAALAAGGAALRADPDAATIIGCFVAQLLVRGLLNVLLVSVSFDLVGLGSAGVGWLAAATGVGGLIGGALSGSLAGRRRLARPFALALVTWGAPIALIGLLPSKGTAFVALALVGLGNALLDVSGFTLVQRITSDRTLARVFGVLFTVGVAIGGVGSVLAPVLVTAFGLREVLVGVGAILPLLALALWRRFRAIDERSQPPTEALDAIAATSLLAPLPPTTLEKLALRSELLTVDAGRTVVAEGAVADRFYVIVDGSVVVTQQGVPRRTLSRGDSFGEIALLHASPRTATVVADAPTRLVAIGGREFVDALSSSTSATAIGLRRADELLEADERANPL